MKRSGVTLLENSYKDYFTEKGISLKDYRAYEIEKFMLFVKYKKLGSLKFSDFEKYLLNRKKTVSSSTLYKIHSVISCFIIWTARKVKNHNLLTEAFFDKLLIPSSQKKKGCKEL